jgi:hypothetical protein
MATAARMTPTLVAAHGPVLEPSVAATTADSAGMNVLFGC